MSIKNPFTGKSIRIGGPTYNELIKLGYIVYNGKLCKKEEKDPILPYEMIAYIISFLPLYHILKLRLVSRKIDKMIYCIPTYIYSSEKYYLSMIASSKYDMYEYPKSWVRFTHPDNISLLEHWLQCIFATLDIQSIYIILIPEKTRFISSLLIGVQFDYNFKRDIVISIIDRFLFSRTKMGINSWMETFDRILHKPSYIEKDKAGLYDKDRNFIFHSYNCINPDDEIERLENLLEQETINIRDLSILCKLKGIKTHINSANKKNIIKMLKSKMDIEYI